VAQAHSRSRQVCGPTACPLSQGALRAAGSHSDPDRRRRGAIPTAAAHPPSTRLRPRTVAMSSHAVTTARTCAGGGWLGVRWRRRVRRRMKTHIEKTETFRNASSHIGVVLADATVGTRIDCPGASPGARRTTEVELEACACSSARPSTTTSFATSAGPARCSTLVTLGRPSRLAVTTGAHRDQCGAPSPNTVALP
jgi:hypothetical protein